MKDAYDGDTGMVNVTVVALDIWCVCLLPKLSRNSCYDRWACCTPSSMHRAREGALVKLGAWVHLPESYNR